MDVKKRKILYLNKIEGLQNYINLKKIFRFSITTITNNVKVSSSDDYFVKDNIVKIGVEYLKGKERIFKEFDKHSIVKSNNEKKELEFTLKTVGERAPPFFTKNIVIYFNCFSLNSVNEKQEEVILLKLSLQSIQMSHKRN